MGRIADFLRTGLLFGILAAALLLPGAGMAQGQPVSAATNPDGSISAVNADGSITTTYPNGTSTTMMPNGSTLASSVSTTTTTTTSSSTTVLGYRVQPTMLYTMYNGYDSEYLLNNGMIVGYDSVGNPIKADFLHNGGTRVLVRLTPDNTWDIPQIDMERGFDRGLVAVPVQNFDPEFLDIKTGTTVTFLVDTGHHVIEPVDVKGLDQSIPLTSGQIFNFTFNEPGHYRIMDGFGGGPTYDEPGGLMIRVTGQNLGANGTLPASAMAYFQQLGLLETTAIGTSSGVTTQTSTVETAPVQHEQTTIQQTTTTEAPTTTTVEKKVVKQHVIRNKEVK